MTEEISLRYFAVVGRAQPLRDALEDARVPFADVRVPMSEWAQQKEDATFAGPYAALPTLTWGGVTLGETLPIASFLARRLGHYDGCDDVAVARLEGISSVCYLDVMLRVAELIFADWLHPGADPPRSLSVMLPFILAKLARLDATIPPTGWVCGNDARPVMADFFATEAFESIRYLVGDAGEEALARRLPRLSALASRIKMRPAIGQAWAHRPSQFTARPDEHAVVERMRPSLLAGLS